jgi:MraZ protein
MPDSAIIEWNYSSLYRHSVDDKRRVPIPFRWRPQESIPFTVTIWPKHKAGTCLRVLPPEQWAKLYADIDAMPNANPNKSVLKRALGTSSMTIKLDSAGRLAIPEEMAIAADISNQAVLAGLIDRFEIWSPKRYEAVAALDEALLTQALETME